jgi:intergrase/recombinase
LRRLASDPLKYQVAYNLLLDSGLRLVEAVKLLNNFPEAEHLEGFYRCPVGLFRGSKQAYYCYLTEYTFQQIMRLKNEGDPATLKRRLKDGFIKDCARAVCDFLFKLHTYRAYVKK